MTHGPSSKRTNLPNRIAAFLLLTGIAWGAGNSKAASPPVLKPWTPIQYKIGVVRVWGREYSLGKALFPKAIKTQGTSILDGPIRLICRQRSKTLVGRGSRIITHSVNSAEVDLTSDISFNPNIKASVTLRVEYDGLMVYHVTVAPRRKTTVNELSLEIPVKASVASYFQKYILMNADWGKQATHAIPERRGVVWQSPFNPYIWIGNEDEGLFWFSQSDEGWSNGPAALRMVRKGGAVTLVVSFINVSTQISKNLRFQFGLQATPTRPLPPHWRSIGVIRTWPSRKGLSLAAFGANPKPDIVILWPNKQDWKWFGFPEPRSSKRIKALIRSFHAQGIKVLAYVQAEAIASNMPAYKAHIAAWQYLPPVVDAFSPDVLAMGGPIHAVNPASGWGDFFLKHLQTFLNSYNVDGLYLDNIYLYPDRNRMQYAAGTVYPVLALRGLLRNIYRMVKQKKSKNLVIVHISGHDLAPAISYSDVILDGEHVAARPWTCQTYRKMLSIEEFQGEFAGWQWGPAPMFLSTLGYKKGCLDSYAPSDYVLAYALVHGDLLWGRFKDEILARVYQNYTEFGVADARFAPYWRSGGDIQVIASPRAGCGALKVSAYVDGRKSPHAALLVVSNLGASAELAQIKLNLKGLNMSDARRAKICWFDAQTHVSSERLDNGAFRLTIPGYSFRLAWIY